MAVDVTLQVRDKMTSAIDRISDTVTSLTDNFVQLNEASEDVANQSFSGVEHSVKDANSELDKMERNTKEVKEETDNLSGVWGRVAGIIATVFAGYQAKQAIDYASDLVEVQNVVDVTFGDSAKTVNEWSKQALNAYGLNELSAKRYSSTLGAMMKSSGLAGDEVMDMSMKMTELAGDMASFYNLNGDVAFEKIKSGISGETEPLKALGINMSDANLQAYAYSQGINKLTKDMSQAEKIQLRYNYLLSVTADAQGDFARTSDSYSNQMKLLKENWKAFTGELATNLLPVLTKVVQWINNLISVATRVYNFIKSNWSVIAPVVYGIVGALGVFVGYLAIVKTWTMICAMAQAVWNAVMMANPVMLIVAGIIILIGLIIAFCQWIAEATGVCQSGFGIITGIIAGAGAVIANIFIALANVFIKTINQIIKPFAMVIEWIVNAFSGGFDNIGDALLNLIGKMCSWLLSFAKVACSILDWVFGTNITDGITNLQNKLENLGKNKKGKDYKVELTELGYVDVGDAFNAGAELGDKGSDKLKELVGGFTAPDEDSINKAVEQNTGAITAGTGAITDNADKNTKKLNKSVDISKENLVYLRDIAEKEAINKFTTAEVKVEMKNNNNINNGMDLNSVIHNLSTGVKEAMQVCADGVY
jgi:hypothetical protein